VPLLAAEDHRMDVAVALQGLGLERYAPAFLENRIEADILPSLTLEDLREFGSAAGDLDADMVAIARAIIRQRTGTFDPSTHRDRYQEALRALIEAKQW
jgi:hypothetical protein